MPKVSPELDSLFNELLDSAEKDLVYQQIGEKLPHTFRFNPLKGPLEAQEAFFREQGFGFHALTGRRYSRIGGYRLDDAEYLILGQGSLIPSAEAVADHLRETRGIPVGVVDMAMFRPFPADLIGPLLKGRAGVTVLERLDQPLAVDLPLMREIRATLARCLENGRGHSRRCGLETNTEKDHGFGRVAPCDIKCIHGGIHYAHIGTFSFNLLQAGMAAGNLEHIAEGGDDHAGNMSQRNCLIQVSVGGNAYRTPRSGEHGDG